MPIAHDHLTCLVCSLTLWASCPTRPIFSRLATALVLYHHPTNPKKHQDKGVQRVVWRISCPLSVLKRVTVPHSVSGSVFPTARRFVSNASKLFFSLCFSGSFLCFGFVRSAGILDARRTRSYLHLWREHLLCVGSFISFFFSFYFLFPVLSLSYSSTLLPLLIFLFSF